MRMGLEAVVVEQRVPPTLVLIPVDPSTHAIGVGQFVSLTTMRAEATSYLLLVKGTGAPLGKRPSSMTSFFTLAAISSRPLSALPSPDLDSNKPAKLVYAPIATMVTLWSGWLTSKRR